MFTCILLGLTILTLTVSIHAVGTTWWIEYLAKRVAGREGKLQFFPTLNILTTTAIVIVVLHILEVGIWAILYLCLPDIPQISTLEQAIYFSVVTFTSLGYGDITLSSPWRLLSGIEAMNGTLLFGWSAALMFLIVQRATMANAKARLDGD